MNAAALSVVSNPSFPSSASDPRVMRHVALGDTGYRLFVWDADSRASTGQREVGYRFISPTNVVLFEGEDYGVSPMDSIDSDAALRGLLGFLTLRPGDTDSEYFANYTPEQLAFANSDAEMLSDWGMEEGYWEDSENEAPAFIQIGEVVS